MIEPVVIILGAVDLVTAVWTYSLLRSEKLDACAMK
jgi:hypothetical protein